ncbi:MAG: hypothetical protein M3P92_12600, partial [Actinomycetota bacterium]|nr:hypothetical protein [Actinomycetota bacterium]
MGKMTIVSKMLTNRRVRQAAVVLLKDSRACARCSCRKRRNGSAARKYLEVSRQVTAVYFTATKVSVDATCVDDMA